VKVLQADIEGMEMAFGLEISALTLLSIALSAASVQ
jgi:hypothetical protein